MQALKALALGHSQYAIHFEMLLEQELTMMRMPAKPPQPEVTPAVVMDAAIEVALTPLLDWADKQGKKEEIILALGKVAEQLKAVWSPTPIPEGLDYWTVDEAAECLACSMPLYNRLWSFAGKGRAKPRGGDGSDGTTEEPIVSNSYDDNMKQIWPQLTEAERQEIATAFTTHIK